MKLLIDHNLPRTVRISTKNHLDSSRKLFDKGPEEILRHPHKDIEALETDAVNGVLTLF